MENKGNPEHPLQDEAAKRSEWRGTSEAPKPEGKGHTLPASEDDDERVGSGGGEGGDAPAPLGTMLPPD